MHTETLIYSGTFYKSHLKHPIVIGQMSNNGLSFTVQYVYIHPTEAMLWGLKQKKGIAQKQMVSTKKAPTFKTLSIALSHEKNHTN